MNLNQNFDLKNEVIWCSIRSRLTTQTQYCKLLSFVNWVNWRPAFFGSHPFLHRPKNFGQKDGWMSLRAFLAMTPSLSIHQKNPNLKHKLDQLMTSAGRPKNNNNTKSRDQRSFNHNNIRKNVSRLVCLQIHQPLACTWLTSRSIHIWIRRGHT